MNRRSLLLAPFFIMAMALPAAAQKISLNALSKYLNGLQTAKGDFTQINDDGTISTGQIYIRRPGRMRFEYNPPEKLLVAVSGGSVKIRDGKAGGAVETYPLKRTPLSIVLAKNVNLAKANMVVRHTSDGKTTTVRAQDPEHPEYGHIDLVFTGNPVELRQWIVTDDGGSKTTVILGDLQKGMTIGNSKFQLD